jgi:ATP-dependent RNA helicase DBP3
MDTSREKDPRLLHHLRTFMKNHPKDSPLPARILVFALYKKEATRLEYTIRNAGYKVAGLHGDLSQDARFKALDAFKEGKVNVLVATDVAARGLDIPDVQLVINVTFPLTTGESRSS